MKKISNFPGDFPALSAHPIGFIKTSKKLKFDTPSQPDRDSEEESIVELLPDPKLQRGLQDLSGFDHIWLIWWFHRNNTWRPMVLPPRGSPKRRGVFSTRSPHRPNPIGISAVQLHKVKGNQLYIGACDLIDGTPILDIKPYIHDIDSIPDSTCGWLDELENELTSSPTHKVIISELADAQIKWLQEMGVQIMEKAISTLERNPFPHRTRRISKAGDTLFRMGCGAWRIYFSLEDSEVFIHRITPGYPKRVLKSNAYDSVPDRDAQIAFNKKWPEL